MACLEEREGDCQGAVEIRESLTGTGTPMERCDHHHEKAVDRVQAIQQRYPDSSTPPAWFDATAAGERWDEDY